MACLKYQAQGFFIRALACASATTETEHEDMRMASDGHGNDERMHG